MKRKGLFIPLGIVLALVIAYLLGPTMPKPVYDTSLSQIPVNPQLAEQMVLASEAGVSNIRPGNQSVIVWANDSLKEKTEYCLLYLHGFSASPMEGNPVHINVGKALGMNVYVPRLAEHGLDTTDPLLNMTPDNLWESAKQALAMASALGDKVIVMGTSTGGTLALKMAADFPEQVNSLILCSPNVRLYDKTASLLARPWGLQIARLVMGGDFRELEPDPETDPYWYNRYRVESLVYLQQLVQTTMKASVFESVKQPTFVGYYYKDENTQDNVVSIEAVHWMFDNLGTSSNEKVSVAFPDAGEHVICCDLTSGSWQEVQQQIIEFCEKTMSEK